MFLWLSRLILQQVSLSIELLPVLAVFVHHLSIKVVPHPPAVSRVIFERRAQQEVDQVSGQHSAFSVIKGVDRHGMRHINGFRRRHDGRRKPVGTTTAQCLAIAQLVEDARSRRLGVTVERFEFHHDRGLVVRVSGGPDAVFGDSHNYDFKVAAWGALLDQLAEEAHDIQEIDLRFGRHLVMR